MNKISIVCQELSTGRIRLRPFDVVRDAPRLFAICSREETVRFYGMEPMQDVSEAESYLASYARGMNAGTSVHWAVIDKSTGLLIGDAGLMSIDNRNGRASSYCILDAAYWGRGLSCDAMKLIFDYAFEVSSLNRIQAYIDIRNVRTIKSVEGIGFVREGVLRDYEMDRGEYIDDAVYAITRLDWCRRRKTVFGSVMRKLREKYAWQRYVFDDEELVWVHDSDTRRYHLLRGEEARKWLTSSQPELRDPGFAVDDNRAKAFFDKLRAREITYEVHWDITNACNSKCIHCYNVGAHDGRRECAGAELSDDECRELLRTLREEGVFRLVVSGGEPLLRPRILELIHNARGLGFQVVLYTNGILVDEEVADKIAALKLVSVEISAYGACSKTHDSVTRVSGSFERSMRALRLLKMRGVHTVMKCVALHANHTEIDDMLALGAQVAESVLVSYVFYPSCEKSSQSCNQMLRMAELVKTALEKNQRMYFGRPSCQLCRYETGRRYACTDCIWSLYLDSHGDVHPCIAIPEAIGNWRDAFSSAKRYADIKGRLSHWRRLLVSDIPVCGKRQYCSYCFSFCPGDALLLHGDEHIPPANHCRLAIARYVASKWVDGGRGLDDWVCGIEHDATFAATYLAELGISADEYVVKDVV